MADVYKIIDTLLNDRGISGAKMSADLGMSRSFMTELRKGRAKGIKAETAQKIADYFGVSVGYLLGEETEKAPTDNGERQISDDDIKAAFFEGADDLSKEEMDAMWDDARDYIQYKLEQRRRKKDD